MLVHLSTQLPTLHLLRSYYYIQGIMVISAEGPDIKKHSSHSRDLQPGGREIYVIHTCVKQRSMLYTYT